MASEDRLVRRWARTCARRLRVRDTGLSASRRAGRAAIVTPTLFALTGELLGAPTVALFAAFGSLATLLFVDFGGAMRARLAAQAGLVAAGAVLICLGTLASQAVWLAAVTTLVVAFVVLFAGVVSSVLAGATTALLVSFILPVTLPGPVSSIPERLAGWLLAGVVSLAAITLLWPAPAREPLRLSTAQACALLARRLRAEVDCVHGGFRPEHGAALRALVGESASAVAALRTAFFGMPYRPTGLTTAARTLVRLVDQVVWLEAVLERVPAEERPGPADAAVCEVKLAAATLLERGAVLLESGAGSADRLDPDLLRLRRARETMERTVTSVLPVLRARTPAADPAADGAVEFVSSLEPSFRAHEMSFVISLIAANVEVVVAARSRGWWQQLLGRRPGDVVSSLSSLLASTPEPAAAHVERHSVWLHNSVRGASALSLAVLVAELSGVQHSFWVAFGTLAVLGSSALNTGQNALRGLLGTVAGFVAGAGLIVAAGTDTTVFWLLLPLVVAFAGLAPATLSFTAGQAGFTLVLLVLYNIIEPAGWQVGLVRIEDVALGCAVSVAVGALLWPRGAGAALGQALAEGFSGSVRYLRGAVAYGITRCDPLVPAAPAPREEARRAVGAARRLDDAFRVFLAERGTKHVSLADVTTLVTGVTVLRLTADAILDLWGPDGSSPTGDRTAARTEVLRTGSSLVEWYERTARALAGSGAVPDLLARSAGADRRLVHAVRRDLGGEDGRAGATAVKVIWTADHLDAVRLLQARLLGPARAAAAAQGTRWSWLAVSGDHRGAVS